MSSATSAYRFVYPTLFTAGSHEAYVIDIPSATVIQTIHDLAASHVCYVEISARHVFVCTEDVLRIFSREDGRNVLDIPSARISCAEAFLDTSEVVDRRAVLQPCRIERQDDNNYTSRRNPDEFVAGAYFPQVQPLSCLRFSWVAHVSDCGSHLVALLHSSRLIVLYNFERVIKGEISLQDAMEEIQLGPNYYSAIYLAFANDRIAVATVRPFFT
jgi:hypothetical protein